MPTGIYERTVSHKKAISRSLKNKVGFGKHMIGKKFTLVTRLRMSQSQMGHKGFWLGKKRNQEYCDRLSAIMKEVVKKRKPEHIQKFLSKMCARPNCNELRGLQYLESIYPGKFKYCGDGSVLINGKSPDAISEELHTVVLFHGTYFHLKGEEVNDFNKYLTEQVDQLPFREAGWNVIVLWEDELRLKTKGGYYVNN
jgi:hypothetical protein